MKRVNVTEGMRYGNAFVLTQTEINRLVEKELHEVRCEVLALRDRLRKTGQPVSARSSVARREAWNKSGLKRYARYRALRERFGVKSRQPWYLHLNELEALADLDSRVASTTAGSARTRIEVCSPDDGKAPVQAGNGQRRSEGNGDLGGQESLRESGDLLIPTSPRGANATGCPPSLSLSTQVDSAAAQDFRESDAAARNGV